MKPPPPKKKLPPARAIVGKHVRAFVNDGGKFSIVTNTMRMTVGNYLPETKCSGLTFAEAKAGVEIWDKFIEDNSKKK